MMQGKRENQKGQEFRYLLRYVYHYQRRFFCCLLLQLLAVLTGLLGMWELKALLEFMVGGSGNPARFMVMTAVLFQLSFSFFFLFRHFLRKTERQLQNDFWFDLYDHLLDVNWQKISVEKDLQKRRRQERDLKLLAEGIFRLPLMFAGILCLLLGSLFFLYQWDPLLALITLLCGGISGYFMHELQKNSVEGPQRVQELEGRLTVFYKDSIQYLRWIQTFSMQDYFKVQLTELQKKWKRTAAETDREILLKDYGWGMSFFFLLVIGMGRCVPFLFRGALSTGSFFWGLLLLTGIGGLFYALNMTAAQVFPLRKAAARFYSWMELPKEIRLDEEWTELLRVRVNEGLSVYAEQVECEAEKDFGTSFPISFEAHPGEWIGIDGQADRGKNILAALLLGQVYPCAGELRLSHVKGIQCQISAATRSFFAYVPREIVIFPGTLADNLRLGRTELTEDELWEALALVCADGFVEMLPQELDTYLSEEEKLLSESELQQLALARAVLADAPVILLEDVTSSLPPALERDIMNQLRLLWRRKTCIFLSPRLPVLGRCDRVYQFSENGLAPVGELLEDLDDIWESAPCNLRQLAEVFSPL